MTDTAVFRVFSWFDFPKSLVFIFLEINELLCVTKSQPAIISDVDTLLFFSLSHRLRQSRGAHAVVLNQALFGRNGISGGRGFR